MPGPSARTIPVDPHIMAGARGKISKCKIMLHTQVLDGYHPFLVRSRPVNIDYYHWIMGPTGSGDIDHEIFWGGD